MPMLTFIALPISSPPPFLRIYIAAPLHGAAKTTPSHLFFFFTAFIHTFPFLFPFFSDVLSFLLYLLLQYLIFY